MPGLDGGEAQAREALQHAGGAEVGHGLDGRRERVRDVVDHRAAVAARGARVAPRRDVEGDGEVGVLDDGPQGVEHGQVVVRVLDVVGAPHRLAGQGEHAEAQGGHPLDLGDRALEIGGGQRGRRRHALDVGAEGLPRPVVPHLALGQREGRVGSRPHGEALVGEDHLGVDAVPVLVAQALARVRAGLLARVVLALQRAEPQPIGAMALGDAPLHALVVRHHARAGGRDTSGRCARPRGCPARWRGSRRRR